MPPNAARSRRPGPASPPATRLRASAGRHSYCCPAPLRSSAGDPRSASSPANPRTLRQDLAIQRLIAQFARQRELQRLRGPLHQEAKDLLVVRICARPDAPSGSRPEPKCRLIPPLRGSRLGNHSSETLIRIDAGSASRCRRTSPSRPARKPSKIRRAPPLHQIPRDLLPLSPPSTAPESIRDRYRARRYRRPAPAGIPRFPPMTRNAAASVHLRRVREPNRDRPRPIP